MGPRNLLKVVDECVVTAAPNLKASDASPMPAYSADRLAQLKKEYEFAAKEPSNLRYGYVRAG